MKLKFWIGIIISILCLYFVFRDIDFHKVFQTLHSVNYIYLILSIILQIGIVWLRAERWKYLLAPIKQLTFRHLLPATMIGFMANNVLPARAGEFIRAYVIGKKENISKTSAFVTIILERICDMITMLVFLIIILLFVKFPQSTSGLISPVLLKRVGALSTVFVLGLITFLALLKEFPEKTTSVIRTLLKPFPESLAHKTLHLLKSFRMGLQVLKTGTHLFFLVFWSLTVWLSAVTAAWLILQAFDLDLSFLAAMFITVMIAFSVAIPSSPGYIGPFHAAIKTSILFFLPDFDESAAAGIAIIFHLASIVPITAAGIYYLWKEDMSFSEIQHAKEKEEQEEELNIDTVDA